MAVLEMLGTVSLRCGERRSCQYCPKNRLPGKLHMPLELYSRDACVCACNVRAVICELYGVGAR